MYANDANIVFVIHVIRVNSFISVINMQQFTVPQFIDVEDKIIGPLTTRQFLIMLAGAALIAICYKFFDFSLFISLAILIFAVCGIFAFFRINGRPFHFFVLNFIQTVKRPPLRIWNNDTIALAAVYGQSEKTENIIRPAMPTRAISSSRLSELSLIVDTRGAYKGEKNIDNKE